MILSILKIILWPKNTENSPRIVEFVPGKINIITGESGSGKSTLTWIMDYCLGSDKCSIPVGLIREKAGWFGLHLKLENTEMIVARRNPEEQQTTTDIFWVEGLELKVPPIITKNARVEDLKNRFNQITNLPSLDFSTEDVVGYATRPSFRDMAAFNFQPQHIVANPYTCFFKADTTEHREKLRIIFPFVLGALEASVLAKQRELKDTEREHERLKRELDGRLSAARAWEAEVESYYMQAKALGLLSEGPIPDKSWELEKYLLELQKVPDFVKTMDLPDIQEGTSEKAAVDLTRLVNDEDKLGQEIGSLRRRLSNLDQLSSTMGSYGVTLVTQEDRLQGVGWLENKLGNDRKCPVCLAEHQQGNIHLSELVGLARELKSLSVAVQQAPPKLDQELAELRSELREREINISKVRHKRKYLEDHSNALASQRQKIRQIYLFVGRVEQALENVKTSRNVGDLRDRVKILSERIIALRRELDPRGQKDRLDAAVGSVSSRISFYANLLKLEHATENVKINIRELTLQFSPLSGRTDYLWEVGSGQNWVGYHVACLLALHEHFIGLRENPVPTFLVLDQPSQVYFPAESWREIDEVPDTHDRTPARISSDIDGVHRIFLALSQFLESVKEKFQIIVTEHAGSITWKNVPNVNLVGNWRSGQDDFLIPDAWRR